MLLVTVLTNVAASAGEIEEIAVEGRRINLLGEAVTASDGANLDRVQVTKGRQSSNGDLNEKVYNVALSDGRETDGNGKASVVGSTVDIADASYTNPMTIQERAYTSAVWYSPANPLLRKESQ